MAIDWELWSHCLHCSEPLERHRVAVVVEGDAEELLAVVHRDCGPSFARTCGTHRIRLVPYQGDPAE